MRSKLRNVNNYGDDKINRLARDVQAALDSVLELSVAKATIVWNPPFLLQIPFTEGSPRLTPPDVIRCERARNVTDGTVLVTPGGCSWEFAAANQVRIDAVSGLTVGQKYDLTFTVVG